MTMGAAGRISVIVPVFQMGRFLPEAIASIEAQGYGDVEIVVVDDGSTDETPDVVASLGNRVIGLRQSNRGPAAARNTGLAVATGEIIAFLDADDLWPEGKLATQLERLEQDPDLDAVLGRIQYVAIDGGEVPDIEFEDLDRKTLSHVHLGSGLFRRRAFHRVGVFDEALHLSEDVDWFMRAREAGLSIAILPEVTLVYRRHETNMTLEMTMQTSNMLAVLKQSLDRRRALGIDGDLAPWRSFDERSADSPTVSVLIPAFDAAKYVREAIRSVLEQTHAPLEVIVVDDGSTDSTVAVASRFGAPVRILRRPHRGAGAARNVGLAAAVGEFVALLDADDVWEREKLACQLARFETDPALDMVFAGVEQFVSPELERASSAVRLPTFSSGRSASAVLMRAEVVGRVGPFREDVGLGEFVDWYDRALAAGCRVGHVDATLVRRRIHDANIGRYRDRSDWAVVMKTVLERRRASEDGHP